MIAHRLLEALSPACSKEITNIELQALHYDFTLKGCKILEAGWRGIRKKFTEEDSEPIQDRKSTRLNSSHVRISYAVFCLKKKKKKKNNKKSKNIQKKQTNITIKKYNK